MNFEGDYFKSQVWDLKDIFRKLVYKESFSRDTSGGGAQDNLNIIPHMSQLAIYLLQNKDNHLKPDGTYDIEARISQYLSAAPAQ